MLEIGRICMKTAGREAGRYCVVVDVVDKEFVMITGPKVVTKVRRRKCNVKHLEPVPLKIDINKNASDDEILKAFEKHNIYEKLRIHKPTEEEIKLAKEREEAKKVSKKEVTEESKKESGKTVKKPEVKSEKKVEKKETKKVKTKQTTGKTNKVQNKKTSKK